MNRAMAKIFGFLNAVVAIVIIAASIYVGDMTSHLYKLSNGALVGLVAGVFVAALLCGPMALLMAMLSELTRIRKK